MAVRPSQGGSRDTWGTELNAWLDVHANADGTLKTSAVTTALGGSLPRTFEDYSIATLVSGVTDCTAAITAALADTGSIGVPIQVLGNKTYLTQGGHLLPSKIKMVGGGGTQNNPTAGSVIQLLPGNNVNLFQSSSWGDPTSVDQQITLQDLVLHGGLASQAEVSPQTYVASAAALSGSSSTVTVGSTSGFAASGYVWIGLRLCAYTGTTGTTFTGVTLVSGQTNATIQPGAWVTVHGSQGHSLALQAALCRITNVTCAQSRGSNVMIQGTPANIAYENAFMSLKCSTANRFGVEFGEQATDNNFVAAVIGDHHGRGNVLDRGSDNCFVSPHFVGSMGAGDACLVVCGSSHRTSTPVFDTPLWSLVTLDSQIRGDIVIPNPSITGISVIYPNSSGAIRTAAITTRRSSAQGSTQGEISGTIGISSAPLYFSVFRPANQGQLLGAQNPTTLSLSQGGSGKIQLDTVADFWPNPTTAQTLTIGGDSGLTYTGKTVALDRVAALASSGATTLTITGQYIPGSAAFAPGGGTILVGGGTVGMTPSLQVTYTSYSNGVFSGCSGISSDIPAGAVVTQCFLIGLSGASSGASRADATQVSFSQGAGLAGMRLALNFGNTTSAALAPAAADVFTQVRGWLKNQKPSYFAGTLTIAAGSSTGSLTHGLVTTPTLLQATPQQALSTSAPFHVSASSTQVTVTLDGGNAPLGGVTFAVSAEVVAS